MAGVGREQQLETETEDRAASERATFEPLDDGTRLDSRERQGQRRAGAQNGSPLVCGRSIGEANCTSLPFRFRATTFFVPRQLATMQPAPDSSDDGSTNFPSAMALTVGGGNDQTVSRFLNATSAAFRELWTDESPYQHQEDDNFMLSDMDTSDSITIHDECAQDASKHSLSSEPASMYQDEEIKPNLTLENSGVSATGQGEFAESVTECDSPNEDSVIEVDSNSNIKKGSLDNDKRSLSNPITPSAKEQLRSGLSRLESRLKQLEGIPVRSQQALGDSVRETTTISENCTAGHSSGTRVVSSGSLLSACLHEEALLRACSEVFPKPEAASTRVIRIFDLRGAHTVVKRSRENPPDEMFASNGLPAGVWWNKDDVFNFYSTREGGGQFTLATIPELVEPRQWVDVSHDLSRGMVVSMSDTGVTAGPTNALYEPKMTSLFSEEVNDDLDDQAVLAQASSLDGEIGCLELSASIPPSELPDIVYHEAFGFPGGIHGCDQPPVFPLPLYRMKTLVLDCRWLLQIFDHPDILLPCASNNEMTVAVSRTIDERRAFFDHNTEPAASSNEAFVEPDDETDGRPSFRDVNGTLTSVTTRHAEHNEFTKNWEGCATDNANTPSGETSAKRSSIEFASRPAKIARLDQPRVVETDLQGLQIDIESTVVDGVWCDTTTIPFVPLANESPANRPAKIARLDQPRVLETDLQSLQIDIESTVVDGVWCDTTTIPFVPLANESRMNNAGELSNDGQHEECCDTEAERHAFSTYGQTKYEAKSHMEEETLAFCQSAAKSDWPGSEFRSRNSDESYSVPCAPSSPNRVEEEERSFYEDENVSKRDPLELIGGFDLEGLVDLHPPARSQVEERHNQVRLLTESQALRPGTPPRNVDRRTGSVSSCDLTTDDEEGGIEDGDDSSRTLHTSSDEPDLSGRDNDLLSCYSAYSDHSTSSSSPFDGLTRYDSREKVYSEDTESNGELFTPVGCARSSCCRKRKANFSPGESPESPSEDPLVGLRKRRRSRHESVDSPCPLSERVSNDDFGMAGLATADNEDANSATLPTDKGNMHRAVLSLHDYCKYGSNWPPSFRREESPRERFPRFSTVDDAGMKESAAALERGGELPEPRACEEPASHSTHYEEAAKLVDYSQLTPHEEEGNIDGVPLGQYEREVPHRRPLDDISDNNGQPRGQSGVGSGALKKVMEVYFDENARRFVVVPASQECLVSEDRENIPPEEDPKTKPASPASGSGKLQVEPCKIQALNEGEVSCEDVAPGAANTSEEGRKDPGKPECEGPRKVTRRIGLPKSFKGQPLHPNWKANADE